MLPPTRVLPAWRHPVPARVAGRAQYRLGHLSCGAKLTKEKPRRRECASVCECVRACASVSKWQENLRPVAAMATFPEIAAVGAFSRCPRPNPCMCFCHRPRRLSWSGSVVPPRVPESPYLVCCAPQGQRAGDQLEHRMSQTDRRVSDSSQGTVPAAGPRLA